MMLLETMVRSLSQKVLLSLSLIKMMMVSVESLFTINQRFNNCWCKLLIIDEKIFIGWWFVEYNGKEGWAPSSYLELPNKDQDVPSDELDEVLTQNGTLL